MTIAKKKSTKPKQLMDGHGAKPPGNRPTATQVAATLKTITIPVGKVSKTVENVSTLHDGEKMTDDQRRRLETLEKTLLEMRRVVGNSLTTGCHNQDDLEFQFGLLQIVMGALTKSGDISVVTARKYADGLLLERSLKSAE